MDFEENLQIYWKILNKFYVIKIEKILKKF